MSDYRLRLTQERRDKWKAKAEVLEKVNRDLLAQVKSLERSLRLADNVITKLLISPVPDDPLRCGED